jgi:S1-C subfamily serine protease
MHQRIASGIFWLSVTLFMIGCGENPIAPTRALSGTQVADRATPATVRIIVQIEATAEVPKPSIDMASLHAVADPLASNRSATERFRNLVNVLLANPARYLEPSAQTRTAKTTIQSQGSGAIFTTDGYIATNAHVVKPDDDDLKRAMITSIKQWVEADVSGLEDAIHRVLPDVQITEEARSRLTGVLGNYYVSYGHISDVSPTIYSVMGYINDGPNLKEVAERCEIKKVGEPIPGKDVAILKMEGSDFPTLPLATSLAATGLRTGAEIYVVGYPGAITISSELKHPSRLEPSQTTGHVSAVKEMAAGWQVIQTDTPINPGNSGGPALDDQGEVIGLATFKLRDEQGINFIVAVDLLQEFLRDLHVKPNQSKFTEKYLQALDAYEHHRREKALTLFRQLSAERPGIRPVEGFIQLLGTKNDAEHHTPDDIKIKAAQDAVPAPRPRHANGAFLIFGAMATVLVLIVVVVVAMNRN